MSKHLCQDDSNYVFRKAKAASFAHVNHPKRTPDQLTPVLTSAGNPKSGLAAYRSQRSTAGPWHLWCQTSARLAPLEVKKH